MVTSNEWNKSFAPSENDTGQIDWTRCYTQNGSTSGAWVPMRSFLRKTSNLQLVKTTQVQIDKSWCDIRGLSADAHIKSSLIMENTKAHSQPGAWVLVRLEIHQWKKMIGNRLKVTIALAIHTYKSLKHYWNRADGQCKSSSTSST